jgi:hypothetical protein
MTTKAKDDKKKINIPDKKSPTVKIPGEKSDPKKTIAELTKEQGVKPFDPSENGKNWPEGADFEEFYNAIQSGRK